MNHLSAVPEILKDFAVVLCIICIIHRMRSEHHTPQHVIIIICTFIAGGVLRAFVCLCQQIVIAIYIRPPIQLDDICARVCNSRALAGNKLVAPVGRTVGIVFGAQNASQRSCGVGIVLLAEDVATAIVVVHPGGTGRVGGGIGRIVYSGHVKKRNGKAAERASLSIVGGEKASSSQ